MLTPRENEHRYVRASTMDLLKDSEEDSDKDSV